MAALILCGANVLVCQRSLQQSFALQWEFPGGKVESGETLPEALVRELREELGIEAVIGAEVATLCHEYAEGLSVELHFFVVRQFTGIPQNRVFQQILWVERVALDAEGFLEADRGVVLQLRAGEFDAV